MDGNGGCWGYYWSLLWIIPSFPTFSTSKSWRQRKSPAWRTCKVFKMTLVLGWTKHALSHPSQLVYPPTPAFAKAGAAPGTTAGVEPVFVGLPLPCLPPAPTRHQRAQSQHVTATLHASSATTLARPQTLKMPKTLRGSLDQALRPQPSVVQGV